MCKQLKKKLMCLFCVHLNWINAHVIIKFLIKPYFGLIIFIFLIVAKNGMVDVDAGDAYSLLWEYCTN